MAIKADRLQLFGEALTFIRNHLAAIVSPGTPIKMLSLGYVDFLATKSDLAAAFGEAVADAVPERPNSERVAAWHKSTSPVIESDCLYRALGFEPHYLDIAQIRGKEIIQDLNQPLAPELRGAFDFVLDSGTLEHCFNVAQGVANVASAVRVGGIVYHANPLLAINHGFYNFSPAFYHDFYRANGFEILKMYGVDADPIGFFLLDGVKRLLLPDARERTIEVIARKIEDRPTAWPMQTKYVRNPNLLGREPQ